MCKMISGAEIACAARALTCRPARTNRPTMHGLARFLLILLGASAEKSCPSCDVSLYLNTGFGTQPCEQPGVDFGCYPEEDMM